MSDNTFEAIVIGVGSMGSAACYSLALRGYKVLGIEQFNSPHDKGAHGGQSRIIRKAYFEHPGYLPLLAESYSLWEKLEADCAEQIYYKTGLLYAGPPGHPVLQGVKSAALSNSIPLDSLSVTARENLFPEFDLSSSPEVLFEPEAGFLRPAKAIEILKNAAKKHGAVLHENEMLISWTKTKNGIRVQTDRAEYNARKLVFTAGAWTSRLLPSLPVSLTVTRQVLAWVRPRYPDLFSIGNFPCWMISNLERPGVLYGFPFLSKEKFGDPEGVKIAWHYPGTESDPDKVNREIDTEEITQLLRQVTEYIPDLKSAEHVASKTCLYTNSADENFVIDHLPGYDNDVVVACGFSGHGFKFVPVVGEILADLVLKGKSKYSIDFLSANRFSAAP
jgi:sarcosine oxidase